MSVNLDTGDTGKTALLPELAPDLLYCGQTESASTEHPEKLLSENTKLL